MTTDIPVLIAGAGPTGLALAHDLARRGVGFRICDKAPAYFDGSRGKGLQPRSLEVLDDFGMADEILAGGRFHIPFRAYEGARVIGDRDIHAGRVPTPDVPYASPLLIPQWRVEQILRGRMERAGHQVERDTELVAIGQDATGVTATLRHVGQEENVRADYLVGCDGGKSFVRHALGVGFEGETWSEERMFVGDVEVPGLDRDHWHSWQNAEHGWLALCPLPGTNSFQLQAQIGPDDPGVPSLERFQEIVDQRAPGTGLQIAAVSWLSLYRVNIRMVDRYRVGRVFLAGDAAHVHSPAGGQGMNTGIQDAYNLGWKLGLVLNGAPGSLLDTYEEERLPVAAWMLGVTTKLHRQIMPKSGATMQRGPETYQLGISYRGGTLARDDRPEPGAVAAGDRAPDAPCQTSDSKPVRLFDLFRGPHFTLFHLGSGVPDENLGALVHTHRIVDSEGHVRRAYGVGDDVQVLVRPDGYIGTITKNSVGPYLKEVGAYTG